MKKKYRILFIPSAIILTSVFNNSFSQNLSGGWSHTLFLCSSGSTVTAWGANAFGQLADGTTVDKLVPTTIVGLTNVKSIVAGYQHSMVLKNDSTVWAWGDNTDGQLGNGTTTGTTSPVSTIGLTGIKSISGGQAGYHSLALKSNGTVFTWGRNTEGQLGDGTLISKNTPTLVPGLSGIIAIAGGEYHTLALKSDGTVLSWGRNNEGQLGNGTTVNSSTPTPVTGLTGVTAIAGGRYFSIALKSDGTVWTWGQNTYGQLGNGTTTNTTTPVQVLSLTDAKAITGSAFHCLVIKSDSSMVSWGRNSDGQLGNGTLINSYTVVPVNSVTKIIAIAAGTNYSLAKKNDGTLYAWGRNANGQLGNSTLTTTNSPIVVINACPTSTLTTGLSKRDVNLDDFSISPNPSVGEFVIINNTNIEIENLEIYNAFGEIVNGSIEKNSSRIVLNILNQPSGIYYLKLNHNYNFSYIKVIKQ